MLLFVAGAIAACDANFTQENNYIMNVKILSLEQCNATPPTISLLEEAASEMGITLSLERIVVKTREQAIAFRHIGSPTVQINGLDIDPGARGINQFGVT